MKTETAIETALHKVDGVPLCNGHALDALAEAPDGTSWTHLKASDETPCSECLAEAA